MSHHNKPIHMVFCDTLKYGLQTHNITVYPWLQEALPQTTTRTTTTRTAPEPLWATSVPNAQVLSSPNYIPATAFYIKDDCYGI